MSKKPIKPPKAILNTYFWIAGVLFLLGIWGFIKGQDAIRDPGQVDENGLVWIYLGSAVAMLVNGILSHKHTVQLYQEQEELKN